MILKKLGFMEQNKMYDKRVSDFEHWMNSLMFQ